MPDTVLGTQDTALSKTDPCPHGTNFPVKGDGKH